MRVDGLNANHLLMCYLPLYGMICCGYPIVLPIYTM